MKKFYIITNDSKDQDYEVTEQIRAYIVEKGGVCILASDEPVPPEDVDCVLALGGDGTLLQAARELIDYEVPLLGINMGTLGYLTEIEVQHVEEALDKLFADKYMLEERMMISGTAEDGTKELALNDIVVSRYSSVKLLHFNIYINGELLNTYQADGVIISTPTGSTAYNLSAGGPILEPTASMFVITPICSHALNTRSIVFSSEDTIEIEITHGRNQMVEEAAVTFDGTEIIKLVTGQRIVIEQAPETTRLAVLSKVSFLETLRSKMKGN